MTNPFGLLDVLKAKGFPLDAKVKVARHAKEAIQMEREGWFEAYQSYQNRSDFHDIEYLISFLPMDDSNALFYGAYEVKGRTKAALTQLPAGCPYTSWLSDENEFYTLDELKSYVEFQHRLVIHWGKSERAWVQNLKNWPILEIRKERQGRPVFRDYLDFNLSHHELREIVKAAADHEDWVARLSAVAGVYLILDTKTGLQYVGSAYGDDGIWGRWKTYAATGHGNNTELRRLVDEDSGYPGAFQFSILQVLPKSTDVDTVIGWESIFKEKLGSRATGLNLN